MKKHFTKDFLRTLVGLSLALVIGLGVNYVAADWQGPSGAPTSGNPNNLLTTGSDQIKTGKLSVKSTTPPPIYPGIGDIFGLQVGDYANAYNASAQKGVWSNGPVGVAGNSGFYGSTDIGPTLNTGAPVTLKVTGIAKISDSEIIGSTGTPNYNLHLVGDTNIGMGNTCALTTDHADEGCPVGSYVSSVNYVANCTSSNQYGGGSGYDNNPCVVMTCRYVNPDPAPHSLGNCYGGGSSSGGGSSTMTVQIAHNWPAPFISGQSASDGIGHSTTVSYTSTGSTEWNTTSILQPDDLTTVEFPSGSGTMINCTNSPGYSSTTSSTNGFQRTLVLDANSSGQGAITGGTPPYTYQWYFKELSGISSVDFSVTSPSFSMSSPTSYGWTALSNTSLTGVPLSARSVYVETFHPNVTTNPQLNTKMWAVLVTDADGTQAFDVFGANDMYECW